jgi:sulfur-carrier protein adenylyltransferase/sulfurtransferase
MNRHGRQMRLAGVGPDGQAMIKRARIDVPLNGLAAEVAVRYLAGAGVGLLRVRDPHLVEIAKAIDPSTVVEVDARIEATDPPAAFGLVDPVSQEVALGAHVALTGLRAVLGVDP